MEQEGVAVRHPFFTASVPIMPPAPPRFSITTGWPSCWPIGSATSRAQISVAPPAGSGTTMRIGRFG